MKRKIARALFVILDILFVYLSFMFFAEIKTGSHRIYQNYLSSLITFGAIWLLTSLIGGKYTISKSRTWGQLILNILKNDTYAITIVLFLIIFFQRFFYSRMIVFGTIFLTTISELFIYSVIYFSLRFHLEDASFADTSLVTKSKKMEDTEEMVEPTENVTPLVSLPYAPCFEDHDPANPVLIKLWQRYLSNEQELFDFINDSVELTCFSQPMVQVVNTATYYNIENMDSGSLQLFINLHKVNDIRHLNRFFIKVNDNLVDGGVYIFLGETITERLRKILHSYGRIFGNLVYLFDFIYRRVFPKIPILQGIYFGMTKGTNRALSETEILGRIYFCGFELINQKEINDQMYFIVKKIKEPSRDENPSYGPLIKLKRKGKDGKLFYVYKLRTMHPYSEYLQEFIYRRNKLEDCGKISNDFRITAWGRILRKTWLDEVPQFINLFKGDISIVGVRPLSEHFLSLYPQDVIELRKKVKPGILPPGVAEGIPKSFDGTVDAERTYLLKKIEHPFMTDFIYFFRILYMILFKRTRGQ